MRTKKWLLGDLVIPQDVLDDVDAHAREAYPGESCGLLSGPAGDPRAITSGRRMPNLADRYHQLDPETYPRTSKDAYVIDGMAMQRALDDGDAGGVPVKVVYHSHCDCGAYFSKEDQLVAAPDGQPVLPVLYLVTSVRMGDVVDDHKLFAFKDGGWVEVPFTVGERPSMM
jgi:proteasome lid subunit RPN8/RPN11